jgi:hypothetical protein
MITLADRGASNITVMTTGEPLPPDGTDDYIKIALLGSTDMIDGGELDWYQKFCTGLAIIAGRESSRGVNIFKSLNYLIFNCKTPPVPDGTMSVNNPAFVNHLSWCCDVATAADGIFVNFLKNSQSVMPVYWFSLFAQSGKLVCRVPLEQDYIFSGLVNTTCQRFNIPCFPGKMGNVMSVIQAFFNFVPKMQILSNPAIQLPE